MPESVVNVSFSVFCLSHPLTGYVLARSVKWFPGFGGKPEINFEFPPKASYARPIRKTSTENSGTYRKKELQKQAIHSNLHELLGRAESPIRRHANRIASRKLELIKRRRNRRRQNAGRNPTLPVGISMRTNFQLTKLVRCAKSHADPALRSEF